MSRLKMLTNPVLRGKCKAELLLVFYSPLKYNIEVFWEYLDEVD